MSRNRGSALFNTLVVVSLLGLAAFFLAASTTSQLQLASTYQRRAQVEQAAQAAVQEVLLRLRGQTPTSALSSPARLLGQFRNLEVVMAPTPRLPVTARILLDRSVENSGNPESVASAFDHPGHRSVPPFSLSVALEISYQGRVSVYEAIIQQRWPYVVTAPGPIVIGGAVPSSAGGLTLPSQIQGRVLALAAEAVPVQASTPPIMLSPQLYFLLAPFSPLGAGPQFKVVRSGGDARVEVGGMQSADGALAAFLDGGVDMVENGPSRLASEVRVSPGNRMDGNVRKDYRFQVGASDSPEARQFLSSLFEKPDTSSWPRLAVDVYDPTQVFDRQTVVGGKARVRAGSTELNRADILLQDVQLAVEGDMVLTGCSLRGSGASLIVDGTMVLDGGELDAGDNGLVLYCRRLIMKTRGHFRGIIVAREGAAFHGDGKEQLVIEGGLLVGANAVGFDSQGTDQGTDPEARQLGGLVLTSTRLVYAPRYLRSLNRYAAFELLGVERRQ
ncbi:hypothetical protein JST97_06045 [bacterium]|nr:hypothetical protein [bacterium]